MEFLREGPMINMIENTKEVMNYITCNIELQTRIQFNRITLATGPVEAMMERYFGNKPKGTPSLQGVGVKYFICSKNILHIRGGKSSFFL